MKKVAIVTGGSRGIGLAIVRALGQAGYGVVIVATQPQEKYESLWTSLDKEQLDFLYVQARIDSADERAQIIQKTLEKYGRIDLLVNNAGVSPLERKDLLEMSEESYDRVMEINVKGNLFLTQAVAKVMLEQEKVFRKRGTIINISSCSAVVSSTNRGEYCISKAAVSMLTTLFADRLAASEIFVHEIRPGIIKTDMTEGAREKYDALIAEGVFPIARWGSPEDVAQAALVCAGDSFLYTTGNVIDVDGGFHIQRL